ncbi:MAG: hypothetical protein M0T70_15380 [Geobacteraceae bacterium]|nr:hypothetical protein [Geobacteraceae bacterium]
MISPVSIEEALLYKLNAVHQMELALQRHMKWVDDGVRPVIEVRFDGKTAIVGNSNAYLNPVLESGILHLRSLIEFIGFKCDQQGEKLLQVSKRLPDDAAVENLEVNGNKLKMITIEDLKAGMGEKAEMVSGSLAFVAWLANKFIAHFTEMVNADQNTLSKVLITSQAIPIIITNHVYLVHGHAVPEYKNNALS